MTQQASQPQLLCSSKLPTLEVSFHWPRISHAGLMTQLDGMKAMLHILEILLVEQGSRGNESLGSGDITFICSLVKRRPITFDRAWRNEENQGANGKHAAR
jgi:hypothetical protein